MKALASYYVSAYIEGTHVVMEEETMALAIAAILFAGFVADVLLGALAGASVLGDVQAMMVLFAASTAFVAAILKREAQSRKR